ncbi:MAG: phage tail protein, partial [Pseudomonadota bacterium]
RSCLEAYHLYWDNPANNPVSSVYGQPMVATDRFYVYAWDARPFPDFPARSDVWADAENWVTGHWLNGRAGRIHLSTLIETLAEEAGLSACDASACTELLSGMTIAEPAPVREALEPLFDLYQLSCRSRDGMLIVEPRTGAAVAQIDEGDLVDDGEAAPLRLHRLQDDEIPNALSITFQDELSGYAVKSIEVRDETGRNDRTQRIGTAVVLEQGEAAARASSILAEAKVMNVEASFGLPDVADGLEPADTVLVTTDDQTFRFRITEIYDGAFRKIKAVSTDPGVFVSAYHGLSADPPPVPPTYGGVVFEALDIPLLPEGEEAAHLWLASFADPWPGRVLVYRGEGADLLEAQLSAQSLIGRLTETLSPGPVGRWDRGSVLAVRLPAGGLSSVAERDVLNGAHLCAVETSAGWEVLQFASASLQPDGSWHLTDLLRGRRGTEVEAAAGAASGARFVLLGQATPLPLASDRWGRTETFEAGPLGADPGAYPFRAFSAQLTGTGARPLAPVHLQSVPEGGGHRVTWLRRTRLGGDQWGEGDVPLGETAEAYQATLYNSGGAVIDTLTTTIPEALITNPDAAKVEVAQISTTYGPGRSATLAL